VGSASSRRRKRGVASRSRGTLDDRKEDATQRGVRVMSGGSRVRIVSGLAAVLILAPTLAAQVGNSFSFVIIADPHIRWSHYALNKRRLERCVDWVNRHRDDENIHLAFVLGDIGWESMGTKLNIETARDVLDTLAVPYVPLIGDDDILFGRNGLDFAVTFERVYQSLESLAFDPASGWANWRKGPVAVPSPYVGGGYCYFQNLAFEYRGVQFICPDWCSRDGSRSIFKTQDDDSDLHDFAGGTWPWFTQCLAECPKDKKENIVILSHNPMVTLKGGWFMRTVAEGLAFSRAEFDKLSAFLNDPIQRYGDHVSAVYSGHVHFQAYLPQNADPARIELPRWLVDLMSEPTARKAFPQLPGYDLYTIQAPHVPYPAFGPPTHPKDEVRLQLVTATEGETEFSYLSRSILVPAASDTESLARADVSGLR
jgi:hypothetical protein